MTIKAVLLDYGDTIAGFFRPDAQLLDAYHQINLRLEADLEREVPGAAELVRAVSHGVDAAIGADYANGSELELDIAAIYDRCLRSVGLELAAETVRWVIAQEQAAWIHGISVSPAAAPTLAALRDRGLRLAIVSNATFPAEGLRDQLRRHGLFECFDATVYSSELGLRKPHRAIYEDALRRVGAGPEEAVFVGDRLREDVRGPRALGIRAFLTHEFRQETPEPDEVTVLPSLAGLPAAIDALA